MLPKTSRRVHQRLASSLRTNASEAPVPAAMQVLVIPAQTMASDQGGKATSVLPMGSVYEGAMFLLFEVMVLRLRRQLGIGAEAMRANHTNLE